MTDPTTKTSSTPATSTSDVPAAAGAIGLVAAAATAGTKLPPPPVASHTPASSPPALSAAALPEMSSLWLERPTAVAAAASYSTSSSSLASFASSSSSSLSSSSTSAFSRPVSSARPFNREAYGIGHMCVDLLKLGAAIDSKDFKPIDMPLILEALADSAMPLNMDRLYLHLRLNKMDEERASAKRGLVRLCEEMQGRLYGANRPEAIRVATEATDALLKGAGFEDTNSALVSFFAEFVLSQLGYPEQKFAGESSNSHPVRTSAFAAFARAYRKNANAFVQSMGWARRFTKQDVLEEMLLELMRLPKKAEELWGCILAKSTHIKMADVRKSDAFIFNHAWLSDSFECKRSSHKANEKCHEPLRIFCNILYVTVFKMELSALSVFFREAHIRTCDLTSPAITVEMIKAGLDAACVDLCSREDMWKRFERVLCAPGCPALHGADAEVPAKAAKKKKGRSAKPAKPAEKKDEPAKAAPAPPARTLRAAPPKRKREKEESDDEDDSEDEDYEPRSPSPSEDVEERKQTKKPKKEAAKSSAPKPGAVVAKAVDAEAMPPPPSPVEQTKSRAKTPVEQVKSTRPATRYIPNPAAFGPAHSRVQQSPHPSRQSPAPAAAPVVRTGGSSEKLDIFGGQRRLVPKADRPLQRTRATSSLDIVCFNTDLVESEQQLAGVTGASSTSSSSSASTFAPIALPEASASSSSAVVEESTPAAATQVSASSSSAAAVAEGASVEGFHFVEWKHIFKKVMWKKADAPSTEPARSRARSRPKSPSESKSKSPAPASRSESKSKSPAPRARSESKSPAPAAPAKDAPIPTWMPDSDDPTYESATCFFVRAHWNEDARKKGRIGERAYREKLTARYRKCVYTRSFRCPSLTERKSIEDLKKDPIFVRLMRSA